MKNEEKVVKPQEPTKTHEDEIVMCPVYSEFDLKMMPNFASENKEVKTDK